MKLVQIKLQNFRGYEKLTTVDVNDMTMFIGKNDSGKSTILEALNIFFENRSIEIDDACVWGDKACVRIGCVFRDFSSFLVLDTTNETSLESEFLLNSEGLLEIHKEYDLSGTKGRTPSIFALASHPSLEKYNDLLSLSISKLKTRARELDVNLNGVDQTKKADIRHAIWTSRNMEDLGIRIQDINLTGDLTGKDIWAQLSKQLPIYALFKSDRASTDKDSEAQDPMKVAVKEALAKKENELQDIIESVKTEVELVAGQTIDKIKEMNPDLAKHLTPRVVVKKLDSIFDISLTGDEDVPINKRGSGVRRLILLNFFRAQAEQLSMDEGNNTVIYAIEEPETSQHPHHQKMIIDSLDDLVHANNCQVLLTTHTPVLARCVNRDYLRYVNAGIVRNCDDQITKEIIQELGILADNNVKLFLGVEGRHDISFLSNLSHRLHLEDTTIPDLLVAEKLGQIICIPMGGNTLDLWVNRINELKKPQFYIMDRDDPRQPKYQKQLEQFLQEGHTAKMTSKRELENYLHPSLLKSEVGCYLGTGDPFEDVPSLFAMAKHNISESDIPWDELDDHKKRKKESKAKRFLNNEVTSQMSLELLNDIDQDKEIIGWLKEIGQFLSV